MRNVFLTRSLFGEKALFVPSVGRIPDFYGVGIRGRVPHGGEKPVNTKRFTLCARNKCVQRKVDLG